jgi:16S rRNA (guanine527-N7)-methyltransferase
MTAGPRVDAGWLAARLAEPAASLGVALPTQALAPLAEYASLLLAWRERINLTGARSAEALADEHLADALALLPHLPPGPFRFVDVGSGAGLPGLVVALLRPDAAGALLEPVRKKHAFLAQAIRALGLGERLAARPERLDAHLRAGGRSAYDVAMSRAVWPPEEWLAQGLPLLRRDGLWLAQAGPSAGSPLPGCERHPYRLHGKERAVLVHRA